MKTVRVEESSKLHKAKFLGSQPTLTKVIRNRHSYKFLSIALIWSVCTAQTAVAACEGEFKRPSYKTRGYYCAPGELVEDAYELGHEILCSEMEVDHLISLRQAWDSGVCGDDFRRLANDPRNLKFTYWRTNRTKGSQAPEIFASTRSKQVSEMIMNDANSLMKEYKIQPANSSIENRVLAYARNGVKHTSIPISALSKSVRDKIIFKKIGGETVAYFGKRAIGYAVGMATGIELIRVTVWAAEWLTSPSQDERMEERAVFFKELLGGTP